MLMWVIHDKFDEYIVIQEFMRDYYQRNCKDFSPDGAMETKICTAILFKQHENHTFQGLYWLRWVGSYLYWLKR